MTERYIVESYFNDEIDIDTACILLEEVGSSIDHPTLEKLRKLKESKGIKAADKKIVDTQVANKQKIDKELDQAVSKIAKDKSCEDYEKKVEETKQKIEDAGKAKAKAVTAICTTLLILPLTPVVNIAALVTLATNKYTTNYGKVNKFSFANLIDTGVNKLEVLEEKRRELVKRINASNVKEELYEDARQFMTMVSAAVKRVKMFKDKIVRAVKGPEFVSYSFGTKPAFAESTEDDFDIITKLSTLMESYDKYDVLDMFIEKTNDENLNEIVDYFM